MSRGRRLAACVALLALLGACASTVPTDDDVDATLRRVAAGVPGLASDLVVVVVNAKDDDDAWEQVARSRQRGPSELSRALAKSLANAHPAEDAYVIGGLYSQLSERVLHDALRVVSARELRGVTALLVSPEEPPASLREHARKMNLLLRYRMYPLPEPEGDS